MTLDKATRDDLFLIYCQNYEGMVSHHHALAFKAVMDELETRMNPVEECNHPDDECPLELSNPGALR